MKVKDKTILWDQKNCFVEVEVIEIKNDVPGIWESTARHEGYKAKDKKGKIYTCNWSTFPDDSPTPYFRWFGKDEIWYDIVYFNLQKIDCLDKLLKNYKKLKYCKLHDNFYYKGRTICVSCDIEKKTGKQHGRVEKFKEVERIRHYFN